MRWLAALVATVPLAARAEPAWRVDMTAGATGSIELSSTAPQQRAGVVPGFGALVQRRVGPLLIGGTFGAGFPVFYGRADLAASVDVEQTLGAQWSMTAGIDAGVGLYYFDAPPETMRSDDPLLYWGPVGRARAQLHKLTILPNGRALGVVFGVNLGIRSARYMGGFDGAGTRLEPGVEVGLALRL